MGRKVDRSPPLFPHPRKAALLAYNLGVLKGNGADLILGAPRENN